MHLPLDNRRLRSVGVIHAGHLQLSKAAQALLGTLKGHYGLTDGRKKTGVVSRFRNRFCRRRHNHHRQRSLPAFVSIFKAFGIALLRFFQTAEDQIVEINFRELPL